MAEPRQGLRSATPELWPQIRTGRIVRAARIMESGSKNDAMGLSPYRQIPVGTKGQIKYIFGKSVDFRPCFTVEWHLPGLPLSTCFDAADVEVES
jgi:hypothetical protein